MNASESIVVIDETSCIYTSIKLPQELNAAPLILMHSGKLAVVRAEQEANAYPPI